MAVTIKTIANLANVSTATVSRFLNNPESVSEKKRKVLAAIISEQNYKRNELARDLVMNKSRMVGVILPDINNIYFSPIMMGIERELEEKGYSTFICNTHGDIEKEKNYINVLQSYRVAGMIFIGTRPLDREKSVHVAELAEYLPVVLINDYILDSHVSFVANNEARGIEQALQYLYDIGHRKIGFINGNLPMTTYSYKKNGFQLMMERLGLDWQQFYIEEDPYEAGGYRASCSFLKRDVHPTAVITANDQMAIGATRAIFEKGYRVPQDISVVGYSNVPISGEIYPRLTTVDQFPIYTGKVAAEMLITQIKKQGANEARSQMTTWLDTQLVIRDSTASCR